MEAVMRFILVYLDQEFDTLVAHSIYATYDEATKRGIELFGDSVLWEVRDIERLGTTPTTAPDASQ